MSEEAYDIPTADNEPLDSFFSQKVPMNPEPIPPDTHKRPTPGKIIRRISGNYPSLFRWKTAALVVTVLLLIMTALVIVLAFTLYDQSDELGSVLQDFHVVQGELDCLRGQLQGTSLTFHSCARMSFDRRCPFKRVCKKF